MASDFSYFFDKNNDHSSKCVNSIDSGPIFHPRLGQDLSRNAFVVSNLFPGRNFDVRKDFWMTPENRDFYEFSTLLEMFQEAFRKLIG